MGLCNCNMDKHETVLLQYWWQKQRSRLQYAIASLPGI